MTNVQLSLLDDISHKNFQMTVRRWLIERRQRMEPSVEITLTKVRLENLREAIIRDMQQQGAQLTLDNYMIINKHFDRLYEQYNIVDAH